MIILCCKACRPPRRHRGCHMDCPAYLEEKAREQRAAQSKRMEHLYIEYEAARRAKVARDWARDHAGRKT